MNADQAKASYARMVAATGDVATIRRIGAPDQDFGPMAVRLTGYAPQELTGNMQEGDRKAILLADDVATSGLPLPIAEKRDRLVIGDRVWVIQDVDDTTRRVAGTTIAYELRVSGT